MSSHHGSTTGPFYHKRAVVTGGTGMIGRHLVLLLAQAGASVKTVSLEAEGLLGVPHVTADLQEPQVCRALLRDVDYVFHLAGMKGSARVTRERPASFLVPMLTMDVNVLEACRANQVPRVLYTSSIGAYSAGAEALVEEDAQVGPPMDFCAWAKRMGEMTIEAFRREYGLLNFAVVRPANVYGPHDSFHRDAMVIPALMHRIRHGEDPLVISGDWLAVRDFVYAEDVARGMMLAIATGGCYNLGSGIGYTIRELVETLSRITGCRCQFESSSAVGYAKRVLAIAKAKRELGWEPQVLLEEGLRRTWEWYRHGSESESREG